MLFRTGLSGPEIARRADNLLRSNGWLSHCDRSVMFLANHINHPDIVGQQKASEPTGMNALRKYLEP